MNQDRVFVSDKLIRTVKDHKQPIFRIAVNCDVNPSSLSRIINRVETVKENDPRILRLAEYLGVNAENCFENEVLTR